MWGVPAGRLPAAYAASARRALRVTLAAATGFYLFRYGLDRPVAATYALFTAVALGGLSHIPGTGRQRSAMVLRLLPVCWVLVSVGTCLSVRTWSAVAGMLVVGFTLTFAAVGGPRLAGAAPGLQLLYILPSFPPYDPGSLGDRLTGAASGAVLLAAAEALLFAEPRPLPYRERAARGALTAERCAARLAAPPYTLAGPDVRAAREAGQALRSLTVPEAERPAGPGVRERALTHTGLAVRTLLARLARLALLPAGPGRDADPEATAVLRAVARLAAATAACLRTGPSTAARLTELAAARARLSATSASAPTPAPPEDPARPSAGPALAFDGAAPTSDGTLTPDGTQTPDALTFNPDAATVSPDAATVSPDAPTLTPGSAPAPAPAPCPPPALLRRHAAVLEIADAALAMGTAADLAVRGRRVAAGVPPGRFWYATVPAPLLWWHRLRGHAGRRSVFFQNAVRIALALTAVRLVAGVDTLPHGFWAMLATLTLTRTTLEQTWRTIRVALAGTLAGALVSAALLIAVGADTTVYAVVLPVWMLLGFTVGPVRGVGWAQGLFTVLVALVFAQLATPTWRLAEIRMLDVLVGSAIGAVFGVLAWPRGAHDELRHAAAELLRRAAEIVVATSAAVTGGAAAAATPGVPGPGHRSLQHAVVLAESAYAQFLSEPTPLAVRGSRRELPDVDWQAVLIAGHHTLWGSARLLEPPRTALSPAAAESVDVLGARVAGRMLLVSAALDPGDDTPAAAPVTARAFTALTGLATEPPGAPLPYYATVSWLAALLADLTRLTRTAPATEAGRDGEDRR
ncbi:FUSC family protein [Streptomyces sp. NPDC013455]|uniref:FUSC family protein n=1 Tax=Streptomyces sp. NPDC013455 TaxID=3155605 RepID=UPI0033E407B4